VSIPPSHSTSSGDEIEQAPAQILQAQVRVKGVASGREFIAIIIALMASGALAIDLMLPAFPHMREEFAMPPVRTTVGWIVTAFFFGLAIGPWLYGPASDRYGRKKLLTAGMLLYILSAIAASLAPSWGWVIASRFVWGLGAAAPRSLSTAMIRDRYEGTAMAKLMSTIMAVFLLVPIIAPSFGAGLIAIAPWRVVFLFPAVVAALLLLWARRLPETLHVDRRRALTFAAIGQAGKEVLTHRQTLSFMLATMFLFAVMTTYLAGSEVIISDVYGYGDWFPFFFGSIAIILAANSLNNARLVHRMGINDLVRRLVIIVVLSSLLLVVISFTGNGHPNFWVFTIGIVLVIPITTGLMPICNTAAMIPVPHIAGTASAIMTTITTAGAALLGTLANNQFDGTVRPFAISLFIFIFIAACLVLFGATSRRKPRATVREPR